MLSFILNPLKKGQKWFRPKASNFLTFPFNQAFTSTLFSKLGLHLPHPVDSHGGKAQFFSEREELEVTLLMKRPMDFINMH